jgi:hypothetical protein
VRADLGTNPKAIKASKSSNSLPGVKATGCVEIGSFNAFLSIPTLLYQVCKIEASLKYS